MQKALEKANSGARNLDIPCTGIIGEVCLYFFSTSFIITTVMSEIFDKLVTILEKSVEKNGADRPVTLGHLLNIVKLTNRFHSNHEKWVEQNEQEALNEVFQDQHKYGTD